MTAFTGAGKYHYMRTPHSAVMLTIVVEYERALCVDPDILEREREIIEDEEHW